MLGSQQLARLHCTALYLTSHAATWITPAAVPTSAKFDAALHFYGSVCSPVIRWSDVLQECMFAYFSSTLDAVITAAKSRGDFDNGIVTLKGMTSIELMHQDVVHKDRFSGADGAVSDAVLVSTHPPST